LISTSSLTSGRQKTAPKVAAAAAAVRVTEASAEAEVEEIAAEVAEAEVGVAVVPCDVPHYGEAEFNFDTHFSLIAVNNFFLYCVLLDPLR
jgi:hypothetical protein